MTETPLTVDLTQLRTVANRADHAADAIATPRLHGCDEELPGSAVAGAASPMPIVGLLDELRSLLTAWAAAARNSAIAFDNAERGSATRIDGS